MSETDIYNKTKFKKDYRFLIISYVMRYFADALFFSFYQIYILSKGLSEEKLGIITGIMPLIVILMNPLWNLTIKNINSNKKIMQIMTVIEGIFIIIFGKISGFELFILVIIVIAAVDQPFYSIFDGYTTIFSNEYQIEFAKIRKYGSLAYIAGSFLGGVFIKELGYTNTFLISGLCYFMPMITFKFIKPFILKEKNQEEKISTKNNLIKIIKNKSFVIYTIIYILMFGTAYIAINFFNAYLVDIRGIKDYYSGYIKAYEVTLEVITILVMTRFGSKIKESILYIFISVFYLAKILPIALNFPTNIIIICAGFHGIGFGSLVYVHYKHIMNLVGEELTTAALLLITIANAIYTSVGNILIGFLIKNFGYTKPFGLLLIMSLLAVILMIIRRFKEKVPNKLTI